jgi:hypothetical protein
VRVGVALVVLCASAVALADTRADLAEADRLLVAGDHPAAEAGAARISARPALLPAERAEALRIRGLALFYLGDLARAEGELAAYLELEPSAHLDPALHPPEAVVFLEEVRARHAGKLRAAPPRRRSGALNLLPPLGQIQNGHHVKAVILGLAEATLLAINGGTYVALRSSCNDDLTCDRGYDSARRLRIVNLTSGALFVGIVAYGIIDGYVGLSRSAERDRLHLSVVPLWGGAVVGAAARF